MKNSLIRIDWVDVRMNVIKKILFSIVIPVYNTKLSYLEEAIQSCKNQTYTNWEIIVIDDGSDESYSHKLDIIAKSDNRIKLYHKKNEGVSIARNTGINKAVGDYVLFLDADDFFESNTLEVLNDIIQANVNLDTIIFSLTRDYAGKSIPITPMYKCNKTFLGVEENKKLQEDVLISPLDRNILVFPYCKCIKCELLNKMQPCFPANVAMCEDVIFSMKLFEYTNNVLYIDRVLYHYRQLWDSAVNKYRENAVEEQDILLIQINKLITESNNAERLKIGFYYEAFYAMQRIIMMKFFHPDAPGSFIKRRRECGKVLSKHPYNSVFHFVNTKTMSRNQRVKAFLLKYHLYACMGVLRNLYFKMPGQKQV